MDRILAPASPETWAAQLEVIFATIWHERMSDVPVINDKLKVETTGFHDWNGHVLGVLVTPWFMNLMMLPGEKGQWSDLRAGEKQSFAFDAGPFEFIVGEEPGLGKFMSCSMFSPMFEFEDHEAAMATANAVIEGLFDEGNQEMFKPQKLGEDDVDVVEKTSFSEDILDGMLVISERARKNMDQPISKRDLLRGSFLRTQNSIENKEREEKC